MLPREWTPEAARAGFTKEQIEAERARQTQAAQAAAQAELGRIPSLRAQAQEMLAVLQPGAARAAIEQALANLDAAQTPAYQVAAVRQLDQAIQQWAQAAVIDRDLARWAAPARAAEERRQAAEAAEAVKPRPLTVEERLARIEKHLGIV